jgi:hypothetical protein
VAAEITPIGPREHKERFAPVPDVVEVLHKLMQAAKKGELRAIAFATSTADNLTPNGLAGSGFVADKGDMFTLSHALATLNRRWGRYCDNEPD